MKRRRRKRRRRTRKGRRRKVCLGGKDKDEMGLTWVKIWSNVEEKANVKEE